MLKKPYLLLFTTILVLIVYTADTQAVCCKGVCRAGGCCDIEDNWYVGCKYARDGDERLACADDVLDDCLVCECSSSTSCSWVDTYTDVLCSQTPKCQTCSYDSLDLPSFSSCLAISDCSIDGVCYQATQQSEGSCCCGTGNCGANQVDYDYATNCPQNGQRVGEVCYYGSQVNNCTLEGWECYEDNFFNCTTLIDRDSNDNTLTSSEPTVETCTSICNKAGVESCCEVDTVICDDNCADNFCVTASDCKSGPFTIKYGGETISYYCHNNGAFYIDTNPVHPDEACDDGYNNNCDATPDGEDIGCAGKCNLLSAQWSAPCALDGGSVSLIINGNDDCAGKGMQISLWEDDDGSKDATFSINNPPQSPVNFESTQTSVSWSVERESSPDDEATEDMEYMFTATMGGRRVITITPLVVKYCAADDSDCDGEPEDSDECPNTPICVEMYEEAAGCSVEQAKFYTDTYKVPGLGFNFFSFALAVLILSALLAYNFERSS